MSEIGDKERALRAYVNWCVYSANWIGEKYGEEGVEDYYRYVLGKVGAKIFELDGPRMLRALQALDNILGSETAYQEDDEKAILTVKCNTGGRAEREGKSMHGPRGIPYYCMHCKIHLQDMARERGIPMTMQYAPRGEGCKFIFEKKGLSQEK
jgi:hypothetical protein